jgi:hypothetical protein
MIKENGEYIHKFSNAAGRWAGVGPYYAMFPLPFAFEVVDRYTKEGDKVLDPFAGRGSSIYAAATLGRSGLGIEINPVGWLYGQAKVRTGAFGDVMDSLRLVRDRAPDYASMTDQLPEFFDYCYTSTVQQFLLAARSELNWEDEKADATLMAILLIYLHGKRSQSLSNQMHQAKAMSPDYSIEWWKDRDMEPPDIDPFEFMKGRVKWRYKKGIPPARGGSVRRGNCLEVLKDVRNDVEKGDRGEFDLLFTSPPYYNVTNYYYDQWLRLWMLGGTPYPESPGEDFKRKFSSKEKYSNLLDKSFELCSQVMSNDASIYVRTDKRNYTLNKTIESLEKSFPKKELEVSDRPVLGKTQTELYNNDSSKPGEVDIVAT